MKSWLVLALGLVSSLTALSEEENKEAVKSAEERVAELEARVAKLEAEVKRLTDKPKAPVVATSPKGSEARPSKGLSQEDVNRFRSLSEEGKANLRAKLSDNREQLISMSAEQREVFMKKALEDAMKEDAAKPKEEK